MDTESLLATNVEVAAVEAAEIHHLADLVTISGDQELTSALKAAAVSITHEAETEAEAHCARARSLRAEAAEAFAAVAETVRKAEEDARLTTQAAEQATDEQLRRHLEKIARADEARVRKGFEWLERAQARAATANAEALTLEHEAEGALRRARSRPEVFAWRQLTAPFLERVERARSRRAVSEAVEDAERQGLADERLVQAAALRTRQVGELARRTRDTARLWARYAPGGDGMYPRLTHAETSMLAACAPGTIFEVSSDRRKLAVHLSDDGLVWVRRKATGPFRSRGAVVRRIGGRSASPLIGAS